MGGEAEIPALRRTKAKEREFDAKFVIEAQLFGLDLAGPGPALKRLGKGQGICEGGAPGIGANLRVASHSRPG